MNSLSKVIVVDQGERSSVDPLASQLAELGVMSVTTSLEAAEDVLALVDLPSAIVLRMPRTQTADYHAFLVLADRLRRRARTAPVPLLMWDPDTDLGDDLSAALSRGLAANGPPARLG